MFGMLTLSKDIRSLGLVFLLVFFAFNGSQQYVTTFFSSIGAPQTGFYSLILVYVCFMLSDPLSAVFVSTYGAKRSMATGILFYSLYIAALATKSIVFIYSASVLLGIAASLLWTGQNTYLIRASGKTNRGTNAGFFSTCLSVGSTLGVLTVGYLLSRMELVNIFWLASIIPLAGWLVVFRLKEYRSEPGENHIRLLARAMTSKTAWRLATVWFSIQFIYGLAIGFIPIHIKNTLGVAYIGLSSVFYLMPILLSLLWGRISDIYGRKRLILASFVITFCGLALLYLFHSGISLITGIILLAINYSIGIPLTMALVGDVTTEKNLEYLTALFWMVQNVGAVSALVLSTFIQSNTLYLISLLVEAGIFLLIVPLLRSDFTFIRSQISTEMDQL
jgi:MFS family permease